MRYIGLLMIANEDDILADVLASHHTIADDIYVLDGSEPGGLSETICAAGANVRGYMRDSQLPRPPYPDRPVDGYRQYLYEGAVLDHGPDNWFLLLHGDEVWTFDPRDLVDEHPDADGFGFRLPCYFPHADDGWDDSRGPLEQLRWRLGPGWPEFRMFRGAAHVGFDQAQHFNVIPGGLERIVWTDRVINHYPFRSPEAQRARARQHEASGFDPDNYRHILDEDRVLWDDELIGRYQASSSNFALLQGSEAVYAA